MPRRPRLLLNLASHVLTRRVGLLPLFDKPADCAAFETIQAEAHAHQHPHCRLLLDAESLAAIRAALNHFRSRLMNTS